ncbi:MAG: tetratricopeptide repeat protein [Acidiphilium sp.]|nr:tetratricopeptide repeat protein [Acidiphilium sp.]MDD4935231.1 tetratricopeptide repeat protein [Acidiphilium sp.]
MTQALTTAMTQPDLIRAYRAMLATSPESGVIHGLLAQALCDDADYVGAITAADAALAADVTLVGARLARAVSLKALCRFDDAAQDFAQAALAWPGRSAVLVNLGITRAEAGRPGEAIATLNAAIAIDPGCAAAFAALGSVHARFGQFPEAAAACRRALALDPDQIAAHRNLAAILLAAQPDEARVHQDAAYRRQQIFTPAIPPAACVVLVLTCGAAASVPLEHLLPRPRYAQVQWFIDYAQPDQDRKLPPHDLIFNAIGDPDLMPPLGEPVRRLLRDTARPVLNHPLRVQRTRRSALPYLLESIPDIVVPAVSRVGDAPQSPEREAWQHRHRLPVIVRPAGSHGGENLHRVSTLAEAEARVARHAAAYVTDFIDYRTPTDQLYRKYRAIFVDRVPYPYHLAIGTHWLVHYWTAGMSDVPARRAEEREFLADPAKVIGARAMAALVAIGARLDLDYAGIDFSLLPDGRLLVFEANATMLVHPESEPMFAYKNPAVAQILSAVEAMLTRRRAAGALPGLFSG